ncbi:N-6 DNA methylase [Archaeoglobus sp.]
MGRRNNGINNADEWALLEKLDEYPWARRKYFLLKEHFKNKEFTREDVEELFASLRKKLIEEGRDDPELTTKNAGELLSILVKAGLVTVRRDIVDYRRVYYKLRFPTETKITRDRLVALLKAAADHIRGGIDYKSLLLFLFYKAVSDRWMRKVEDLRSRGLTEKDAYIGANKGYFKLYDEKNEKLYVWHEIVKTRESVKEMANALIKISEMNKDEIGDLSKLVETVGLLGFIKEDNLHKLEEIVKIFNRVDSSEFESDLLGDAYEWILSYFAPQKAKEGEVYTPREVVKLLVRLLDIDDGADILDPACGSGGMLIEAYRYVRDEKLKGDLPSVMLYGQELNEVTATLAKMNLILHGIQDYEIYGGYDSLVNPQFEEADYVIANPPWNQDGYDEHRLSDKRVKHIYKYGFTNKQSADWAWVQLMLHYAKKKVGIVLDSGALFRSGAEKNIRMGIVEDDLIEAIVLLPEKLFYNSGAPGIIMILNKNKPEERKGKILFINASLEYEKHPEVRRLNRLGEEHIKKIVEVYRKFKEVEEFSRIVSLNEVKEKDYNLNVSLYVYPEVEGEKIDLAKEFEEFKEIEEKERVVLGEALGYVGEILKVGGE